MSPTLEQEIRDLRQAFWSERDPDGRAFAPLADAFRRSGELGEAVDLLKDGLGRLPDYAAGHLVSAWVHRDRGEGDQAEAAFRRVLDLDPENARALHGLGQLLARRGRVAAGRDLVLQALDLDPVLEWEEGGAPGAPREGEREGSVLPFAVLDATAPADLPDTLDEVEEVWAPPAEEEAAVDEGAAGIEAAAAEESAAAVEDAAPEVVDIRSLAPESPDGILGDPDGRGPIVEIGWLAPDEPEVVAPPAAPAAETPEADGPSPPAPAAEHPGDPGLARPGPEVPPAQVGEVPADEVERPGMGRASPDRPVIDDPGDVAVYTRTMAELYVRQGLTERALEVYRRLARERPGDEGIRERLEELRVRARPGAAAEGGAGAAEAPRDESGDDGSTDENPGEDFDRWLNEP